MKNENVIDSRDQFTEGPAFNTNDNNRGFQMDKFVTKQELENSELRQKLLIMEMDKSIALSMKELSGKLDNTNTKIEDLAVSIPLIIDTKMHEAEKENRKNHTETIRFVFGTVVLGVISIIIALLK